MLNHSLKRWQLVCMARSHLHGRTALPEGLNLRLCLPPQNIQPPLDPPEQQAHTQLEPPRAPQTVLQIFNHSSNVSPPRIRYIHSVIELVSSPRVRCAQFWTSACMRSYPGSWHINSLVCSSYKTVHPAGQADRRILFGGSWWRYCGQHQMHCTEAQLML